MYKFGFFAQIILKTKLQKCLDENQALEEKLAQGRSTSRDSAAYADGTSAKELGACSLSPDGLLVGFFVS
jgi:hypothetical protein